MSISRNLDAYENVANFASAYVGPGVYVLYDGRVADSNIVYIGKSTSEILMRVSQHQKDKDFDRVGIILPRRTDGVFVHNLEHYVFQEFKDAWGVLPPLNTNDAHFHPDGPEFDWHGMARRKEQALFVGAEGLVGRFEQLPRSYAKTVGAVRRLRLRIERENPQWHSEEVWGEIAMRLGGVYSASTLQQYCSRLDDDEVLPRLIK